MIINRHFFIVNIIIINSHQAYLRELAEEYEEKLENEQQLQKSLQSEKESLAVTYEGQRDDTEIDGDIEIEDMKAKYEVYTLMSLILFNIIIIYR